MCDNSCGTSECKKSRILDFSSNSAFYAAFVWFIFSEASAGVFVRVYAQAFSLLIAVIVIGMQITSICIYPIANRKERMYYMMPMLSFMVNLIAFYAVIVFNLEVGIEFHGGGWASVLHMHYVIVMFFKEKVVLRRLVCLSG